MKKLLVLALAGLISMTASANWLEIESTVVGMWVYINGDTVTTLGTSGQYRKATARYYFYPIKALTPEVKVSALDTVVKVDCHSTPSKMMTLSAIGYNGDKIVSNNDYSEHQEWTINVPGGLGERISKLICSR